jgi:hypothetical protein
LNLKENKFVYLSIVRLNLLKEKIIVLNSKTSGSYIWRRRRLNQREKTNETATVIISASTTDTEPLLNLSTTEEAADQIGIRMATAQLAPPSEFVVDNENSTTNSVRWLNWLRRCERFMEATSIKTDDMKMATLLTACGESVEEIYEVN